MNEQTLSHLCQWCKNKDKCDVLKIYQVVVYECVCTDYEVVSHE